MAWKIELGSFILLPWMTDGLRRLVPMCFSCRRYRSDVPLLELLASYLYGTTDLRDHLPNEPSIVALESRLI